MGAAMCTAGRPYYRPERNAKEAHRSASPPQCHGVDPVQPPPAYVQPDPAPPIDLTRATRENVVGEMKRLTHLIRAGQGDGDLTLHLQALLKVNTGIVVMADTKVTPTLHETCMVAEQAVLRWDLTKTRTRYDTDGHCVKLTEHVEESPT